MVLRLRPSPYGDGWDVLVRLTPLPLSARPRRAAGFAAAANLRAAGDLWRQQSQTRVFHKGHHPRIYVLARAGWRWSAQGSVVGELDRGLSRPHQESPMLTRHG